MASATTTAATGAAPPPVNISMNGAFKGKPPPTYDGNRQTSREFIVAFKIFHGLNRDNASMTNPYSRVLTILTYMDGEIVNAWKESQVKKLEDRVLAGIAETDEAHWQAFENDFKTAFTNTNAKAEAYQALAGLKHTGELDAFVAKFKQLVDKAEVDADSHGVIELFKRALNKGLIKAILHSPSFDPLNPWTTLDRWIREAHSQHIKWKTVLQYSQKTDHMKQGLYHAFKVKPRTGGQGRRTTSQGGDAMDVDTAEVNRLTDDQKTALMKTNKCFYCQKPGHRAAVCYKKKRDQGQGSTPSSTKAAIDIPDNPKLSDIVKDWTATQWANMLKEQMPNFDNDTKLDVVESLLPQGFPTALD